MNTRMRRGAGTVTVIAVLTGALLAGTSIYGHPLSVLTAIAIAVACVAFLDAVLRLVTAPPPRRFLRSNRTRLVGWPVQRASDLHEIVLAGRQSPQRYGAVVHPLLTRLVSDRVARRGLTQAPAGPLRALLESPPPTAVPSIADIEAVLAALEEL